MVAASEQLGIQPGMPLAEALALGSRELQKSPSFARSVQPVLHDPVADRLALTELAQWCQKFSPTVGWEPAERPDCLLLDMTGLATHFGGERAMIEQILGEFRERSFTVNVSLAGTIGAAWAQTHFGSVSERDQIEAMPKKLTAGGVPASLAVLPVTALRLSKETVDWLTELGVLTIGQVASLPRAALASRLGPELMRRLDQATGVVPEVIQSHHLPPEFASEWLFETPVEREEAIDYALQQTLAKLAPTLEAQRKGATRLECRLTVERGPAVQFEIGLYRASATVRHLLELIRLRLESLRVRQPVAAVRIAALSTGPLPLEQQSLFDEGSHRSNPRELATLVDRLASRLGRQAVLRPALLPDAQPEHACQYAPVASEPRRARPAAKKHKKGAVAAEHIAAPMPLRPIWLRVKPATLDVIALAPEGHPVRFHWAGQDYEVKARWGPERVETGWWRGQCVRRDYYQVETASGQRFWIFRHLNRNGWFLHGEFA